MSRIGWSAAQTGAGQPAATTTTESSGSPVTSASTGAPDDRATAFRAAKNGEAVPGGSLLIAAYAVVWVVILLIVVRTFRRQTRSAEQLDALERAITKAGTPQP